MTLAQKKLLFPVAIATTKERAEPPPPTNLHNQYWFSFNWHDDLFCRLTQGNQFQNNIVNMKQSIMVFFGEKCLKHTGLQSMIISGVQRRMRRHFPFFFLRVRYCPWKQIVWENICIFKQTYIFNKYIIISLT